MAPQIFSSVTGSDLKANGPRRRATSAHMQPEFAHRLGRYN